MECLDCHWRFADNTCCKYSGENKDGTFFFYPCSIVNKHCMQFKEVTHANRHNQETNPKQD